MDRSIYDNNWVLGLSGSKAITNSQTMDGLGIPPLLYLVERRQPRPPAPAAPPAIPRRERMSRAVPRRGEGDWGYSDALAAHSIIKEKKGPSSNLQKYHSSDGVMWVIRIKLAQHFDWSKGKMQLFRAYTIYYIRTYGYQISPLVPLPKQGAMFSFQKNSTLSVTSDLWTYALSIKCSCKNN